MINHYLSKNNFHITYTTRAIRIPRLISRSKLEGKWEGWWWMLRNDISKNWWNAVKLLRSDPAVHEYITRFVGAHRHSRCTQFDREIAVFPREEVWMKKILAELQFKNFLYAKDIITCLFGFVTFFNSLIFRALLQVFLFSLNQVSNRNLWRYDFENRFRSEYVSELSENSWRWVKIREWKKHRTGSKLRLVMRTKVFQWDSSQNLFVVDGPFFAPELIYSVYISATDFSFYLRILLVFLIIFIYFYNIVQYLCIRIALSDLILFYFIYCLSITIIKLFKSNIEKWYRKCVI